LGSFAKIVSTAAIFAATAGSAALAAPPAVPVSQVRYDGHLLIRATPATFEQVRLLTSLEGRLMSEGVAAGAASDWIVSPEARQHLVDAGVEHLVVEVDVQRTIDAEAARLADAQRAADGGARNLAWFSDYKNRTQIEAYLDTLMQAYPDMISETQVGTSIEGTPIYEYAITSPVGGPASDKPAVLFNGMIHSREWISPMTVMYFIDQLLENYGTDPEITRVMDELTWYIIPVNNPDGYDYSWSTDRLWRKNRRNNGNGTFGVDLNRNFPVGFANGLSNTSNTSSDIYHGTAPFSEPEAQALRDSLQPKTNVKAFIDFHSYSQLILWPLGYDFDAVVPEPDNTNMINLSFAMRDALFAVNGVSYTAQNSTALYPAGGVTQDWAYEDEGVYAWTFELRPASQFDGGFILPADQILPTARENFAAVLTLADAIIDGVQWSFPGGLPTTVDADADAELLFSCDPLFGETLEGSTATLHYRSDVRSTFSTVSGSPVSGNTFAATLPGQPCGSTVEYFFTVQSTVGETFRSPDGSAVNVLNAAAQSTVAQDDMESATGWTVGAPGDTAFTGIWENADPVGTAAQPEDDHTPTGTKCWVTGAAGGSLGADDIDGGATSLISPTFDLASASDAVVRYWRWYSNDQGASPNADVFRVFISDDGGASYSLLEEVGPDGPGTSGGWTLAEFTLSDIGVSPTAQLRLKFTAEDAGSGSVVEAAIDDLDIVALETCCEGDATGDGAVNADDLLSVLANFGNQSSNGDVTGDGAVNADDLLLVLANFGTACP